jgi:formate hydrogenlyase subunit 4
MPALQIALHAAVLLLLPPLLPSVIARVKAMFAGRRGPPLLQPYWDLWKLLRKGSAFSRTTTWIFRAGPVVSVATALLAGATIPLGANGALLSFAGDLVLLAYLFGLSRFFTVAAALDTGSAFEGMGSAREATFSCLAEPTLFLGLLALVRLSGATSLAEMLGRPQPVLWGTAGAPLVLIAVSLFIVLLAENCRIPFDDPNTHLELTMIHEVMVLDHSGPAFGLVLWGAALKLFVWAALLLRLVLPIHTGSLAGDWLLFCTGTVAVAGLVGVVESSTARLRLVQVPRLLVSAMLLSAFGLILAAR